MSRTRLTAMRTAGDPSLGQSANDYWRKKALEAVRGVVSQVEKQLMDAAQQVTNQESGQLGVAPAQYAPAPEPVAAPAAPVAEEPVTAGEETSVKTFEPKTAAEQPVEPKVAGEEDRTRTAGAPVNPQAIGAVKWQEVKKGFPQYVKNPPLTMLQVAPTKYVRPAVQAIVDTLGGVAAKLETLGDVEAATQLDVVAECLMASVDEAELQAAKYAEECAPAEEVEQDEKPAEKK